MRCPFSKNIDWPSSRRAPGSRHRPQFLGRPHATASRTCWWSSCRDICIYRLQSRRRRGSQPFLWNRREERNETKKIKQNCKKWSNSSRCVVNAGRLTGDQHQSAARNAMLSSMGGRNELPLWNSSGRKNLFEWMTQAIKITLINLWMDGCMANMSLRRGPRWESLR